MQDQSRAALDASEEKFRRLFESAQDGILILDFETGKIVEANPYIVHMLGFPKSELVGKLLWEIGAIADKAAALDAYQTVKSSGFVRYENLPLISRDGTLNQVEFVSNSYTVDGERVIQCNIRDASARAEAEQRVAALERQARDTSTDLVNTLAVLIDSRDPYTAGHLVRVADLASAIAVGMGLSADTVDCIRVASMLHDIGKIGIPMEILVKPTALRPFETAMLMNHAQAGFDILKHIHFPWKIADIVLQHHERLDGSGYPRALKAPDISLEARILAVADTAEAMSNNRPFRPGRGIDATLSVLEAESGVLYDPIVVNACVKLFRTGGYHFPPASDFVPRFVSLSKVSAPAA